MAKAREIAIDPGEPFAVAARRVVSVRAAELFDHAENVLDIGDIERVHDMRVTTRRLRAALEVFAEAFPKGQLRPVLRDVKRLADALGERRDPDVHIAEFTQLRAELAEADPPGRALLRALRGNRAQARQGRPGPARRGPRLRRDAPAPRPAAHAGPRARRRLAGRHRTER